MHYSFWDPSLLHHTTVNGIVTNILIIDDRIDGYQTLAKKGLDPIINFIVGMLLFISFCYTSQNYSSNSLYVFN